MHGASTRTAKIYYKKIKQKTFKNNTNRTSEESFYNKDDSVKEEKGWRMWQWPEKYLLLLSKYKESDRFSRSSQKFLNPEEKELQVEGRQVSLPLSPSKNESLALDYRSGLSKTSTRKDTLYQILRQGAVSYDLSNELSTKDGRYVSAFLADDPAASYPIGRTWKDLAALSKNISIILEGLLKNYDNKIRPGFREGMIGYLPHINVNFRH